MATKYRLSVIVAFAATAAFARQAGAFRASPVWGAASPPAARVPENGLVVAAFIPIPSADWWARGGYDKDAQGNAVLR
jgi:hypothetical protein